MQNFLKLLEGKKTYAIAITILACGILGYFKIEIPEFVWSSLAALGLGFLRQGLPKK